jgi:hypothetical protein
VDRLAVRPAGSPVRLPILVTSPFDIYPWDGLLLDRSPVLRTHLDPYRVVPRPALSESASESTGTSFASRAVTQALGRDLTGAGVSHAIARAIRTSEGLRLDLGDERAEPLRPTELLALGRQSLIVLQGLPQPVVDEKPTDASRLEMGLMRELAWILCDHGADGVLVLPETSLATAEALIATIAKLFGRHKPGHGKVLGAARAARDLLREYGDAERALEVTAFVAEPTP